MYVDNIYIHYTPIDLKFYVNKDHSRNNILYFLQYAFGIGYIPEKSN